MNHLELLRLCETSYEVASIRINEVEALVQIKDGVQYVAFRGTEASKMFDGGGWRDVLRDFRTIPWHDKRVGWSHAGFLKGARNVVDDYLLFNLSQKMPVIVTGHSLGGGLAVNAAALLCSQGYTVQSVVTFGSPRTFLKSSAERWVKFLNVTQYSNDGDPVCDVPFRFWGYRHLNEIKTNHKANGYSMKDNHGLNFYRDGL